MRVNLCAVVVVMGCKTYVYHAPVGKGAWSLPQSLVGSSGCCTVGKGGVVPPELAPSVAAGGAAEESGEETK